MAVDGLIDVSQWNFETNGIVDLNGEWKFRWNEDNPDFVKRDFNDSGWDRFNVPGTWNSRTKTSFGFCWLRLKLTLPPRADLSLYCLSSLTSASFYVNGKKIEETGKAGNTREASIAQPISAIIPLLSDTIPSIIAWKISNYADFFGGPIHGLQVGTSGQILQRIWRDNILALIIIGIYLMMFCYYCILWLERKNDKATFCLFLYCLVGFLHYLNFETGKLFFLGIPFIYALKIRLDHLLCAWLILIAVVYSKTLFQADRPDVNDRGIFCAIVYAFVETLVALIVPTWLYSIISPFSHIISLLWCLYIWHIVFSGYIRNREDSLWMLIAITIVNLFVAHDILTFYFGHIPFSQHITQYGFFIFLLIQSVLILQRFFNAFKKAEYLSRNLTHEVELQTVQLSNQKKELEFTNNKLKELDRFKTQFFQNITHELRTPLTLILGPLETAIKNCGVSLPLSVKDDLHVVRRNACQMLDLVNQVLDLSKIDAGMMRLSLEKINIISLCESIYRSFFTLAESKNIIYKMALHNE